MAVVTSLIHICIIKKVITILVTICPSAGIMMFSLGVTMNNSEQKKVMKFYNMSAFLKGQSSKIITSLSEDDDAAFILKNGKPLAVLISNERYERLLAAGIDILEY